MGNGISIGVDGEQFGNHNHSLSKATIEKFFYLKNFQLAFQREVSLTSTYYCNPTNIHQECLVRSVGVYFDALLADHLELQIVAEVWLGSQPDFIRSRGLHRPLMTGDLAIEAPLQASMSTKNILNSCL